MTTYSSLFIKRNGKIPTVLAIAIVAILTGFIYNFTFTSSRPSQAVKTNITYLEITNISPSQATVVWQTSEKETGWVLYGNEKNNTSVVALDDRDVPNYKNQVLNHYATLKNLEPKKRYYFRLTDGQKLLQSGNNSLFSFQTPPQDNRVNNLKPAYGKLVSSSGQPIENAVVILSHKGSYSLSTLSKTSGEWLIPMNIIIHKATLRLQTPSETGEIHLLFMDEEGRSAKVTTRVNLANPLPETITIGKSYVFEDEDQVLSASTTNTENIIIKKFNMLYPKDNAVIPVSNPLIKGTSEPGKDVVITLQPGPRKQYDIRADREGFWKLDLPLQLPAGSYNLTATLKDLTDKTGSIQRRFTITKSGESVLAAATDSAQLTSTPTPTASSVISQTPTPTPILAQSPTPIPTLPTTGSTVTNFMLSSFALILLGVGLLVVF